MLEEELTVPLAGHVRSPPLGTATTAKLSPGDTLPSVLLARLVSE